MPSLYPYINTAKITELFENLITLDKNLKKMPEFYGKNKLLNRTAFLLENEENVQYEDLMAHKNEISNITNLINPIGEIFIQLDILKDLVRYCDSSEIQDQINVQEKELKKEIIQYPIDSQEVQTRLAQINSIFYTSFENIFAKLKELLKKSNDDEYKEYFDKQLEVFVQLEKIRNDLLDNSNSVSVTRFIIGSIREFERLHQLFLRFNGDFKENYGELISSLLNFEDINSYKNKLDKQIQILHDQFKNFDSDPKIIESVNNNLEALYLELNELYEINCEKYQELKERQKELLRIIEITGNNLNDHAEKLSQSHSFSAKAKYEKIRLIKDKVDLLLSAEKTQESEVSNQTLTNTISDLQMTMNDARETLSKYRGISFLRCFATFWGGGKVTSLSLVNVLEEDLVLLQRNMNVISPKH